MQNTQVRRAEKEPPKRRVQLSIYVDGGEVGPGNASSEAIPLLLRRLARRWTLPGNGCAGEFVDVERGCKLTYRLTLSMPPCADCGGDPHPGPCPGSIGR